MKNFEKYFINSIPKIDTFHPYYSEAIEYIIKNNGKYFRPKLMLSIVKEYEPLMVESSYKVASAVELFHTYSLIHDDLPAMDNSPLRRGKPTLHTIYDDATAILIGDALNTYSFELISKSAFRDDVKVELIKILSTNGGLSGMVLGQAIDLEFEKSPLSLDKVEIMHINKTAKLIATSLVMGAIIVDLDKQVQNRLYQFGIDLGLLFQVQDDIMDATKSVEEIGKPTGFDEDKNSFVNILGLSESIEYANRLAKKIESEFSEFEDKLQKALKEPLEKYLYRHIERKWMSKEKEFLQKQANTIRFLSADMIEKAQSGHPGAPLGLADIAVVLSKHLKHNPKNPKWLNRDRLVFSGGHASALVYSLLHLWGYDLSLDDLKNFRQLNSKTAGHPEYGHTEGVEITTGPLGQGVANAVGFAMAKEYNANKVNSETCKIIDHKVYCFCGDGDLEEGISYEACSVAGKLNLKDLILIYDSNNITIEGDTSLAWNEDVEMRFKAMNWNVIQIDGHCYEQIDKAISDAKVANKPTIIIANTVIARGAVDLEGDPKTHGAPLGKEIIKKAKTLAGFPADKEFYIPEDVLNEFRKAVDRGEESERAWHHLLKQAPYPEQNEALKLLTEPDFSKIEWPELGDTKEMATRDSNGQILNAIAKSILGFLGGSADLGPSNKTTLKDLGEFPKGKNIHFGIREHSMAAISNAMALYGTIIPFNATFFVFSDYLKPSARIAALSNIKNFFIWTHDSIGVGEDGPTHQPIEQLSQFRALPNFYVWRPADATENVKAWKKAITLNAPQAFVLSRQKLKTLKPEIDFGDVDRGAYIIKKRDGATLTIAASGSEVMPSLMAGCFLEKMGVKANIVSMPCFDLFDEQDSEYKSKVFDRDTKILAVEASRGLELYKYADDVLSMESFGASGPANELFEKFGFTIANIKARACQLLGIENKIVKIKDIEA